MIKKIRSEDLQVGMFVHDFNTPWINHPFLAGRRKIGKAGEIDVILAHGIPAVTIDTARGADSPRAFPAGEEAPAAARPRPPLVRDTDEIAGPPGPALVESAADTVPFDEELRKAREVYDQARATVQDIYHDVRLGKAIDGERARDSVGGMIESVFRNRDALLSLARLKSYDDYTFQHSLNVAVLSLNLGSHLGILDHELLRLGIGALLHDLGKVFLPASILNKRGPLTKLEFGMVKKHPEQGARLLEASDSVPEDCALVANNHHERYDGSGYPNALTGMGPGKFGLIAALADVYDAMTTTRSYQQRFPPTAALKKIYGWEGSFFHPIYVRKFIQCLGIYPSGTVVQLDNHWVGVVLRQNRDELLHPWVRVCRDAAGHPLAATQDVDLRQHDGGGQVPAAREVVGVLDPKQAGVDPDAVLQPPAPGGGATLTVVMA
jgi:putative nucleotidyltransferase with HDIG domain